MCASPKYSGEIPNNLRPYESTQIELKAIDDDSTIQASVSMVPNSFPLPSSNEGSEKKPFKSSEMIVHLSNRVNILNDSDKTRLERLIHEKSYFRVAYFSKLLVPNSSQNLPGLDDLVDLINFDSFLRSSIARLTPDIELYLKSSLMALLLSKNNIASVYLDRSLYKSSDNDKKKLDETLSVCATALLSIRETNGAVKHQIVHHGGHIPIWVLFEALTFGQFNMLNSRLEKNVLKDWANIVIKDSEKHDIVFDITLKLIPSLSQTVQFLRNTAAHNTRVLQKRITSNPAIKSDNSYWEKVGIGSDQKERDRETHTVFTGLMVMRLFYACLEDDEINHWNTFCDHLSTQVKKTKCLSPKKHLGFPSNWESLIYIR